MHSTLLRPSRPCLSAYLHVGIAVCTALAISGCSSIAMNGLNGAGMCPPEALANANAFAYSAQAVRPGDPADFLYGLRPERVDRLQMPDGRHFTLKFYRTGHPRCRNMPTSAEFTPVLLSADNRVVALGQAAVGRVSAQAVQAITVSDETPRTTLTDVLMGRF